MWRSFRTKTAKESSCTQPPASSRHRQIWSDFRHLGDALTIVRGPPKPDPNSPDLEPLEPFVAAACANASQAYGPV